MGSPAPTTASQEPPGPQLSPEQAAAVDRLLPALRAGQLASLVGAAGTGKTFLTGHLLRQLEGEGLRCLVATPSHKAARVARQFLADAGAQARVCTIASLLKLRPSLDRDGRLQFASRGATEAADALRGEPPHLIVADEASMISDSTARDLWALAQEVEAALLLTGDRYQLPPINAPMASLFLDPPGVRAELTEVRRTAGATLQLANAIRTAEHPSKAWPTTTVSSGGTRVVVHRWQSGWQAAAAKSICSERWDADPDAARVIAWANRTAASVGQKLREHRYGTAAARSWMVGEVLIAPGGIQAEGAALAPPQAAACSEFRILALEPSTRLEHLLGVHPWRTPTRGLERELEVAAGTDAQRAQLENIVTGEALEAWLEPPAGLAESWSHQCREIRNSIRAHLEGGDRKKALAELADLESVVPVLRQACALTAHSSQGSTFAEVFVAGDLTRCDGPEAGPLSYVAISRASAAAHVLPWLGSTP